MGRDSAGDVSDSWCTFYPLDDGYRLQSVPMCGYRIIDGVGNPVTQYFRTFQEFGNLYLEMLKKK